MSNPTARAARPYFIATPESRWGFIERDVEFTWHKGMSWQVKQRSSLAMQAEIERLRPALAGKVLEVSTKSVDYELGCALSAFNLTLRDPETGEEHPLENWFQSSKRWRGADGQARGPYPELLELKPADAKSYVSRGSSAKPNARQAADPLFARIQGELADARFDGFEFAGRDFPTTPRSAFYDYLYATALSQERNAHLGETLVSYRAFTDIEFKPTDARGHVVKFNTQARSCAIYVTLAVRGTLAEALADVESFIEKVGYPPSL